MVKGMTREDDRGEGSKGEMARGREVRGGGEGSDAGGFNWSL